MITYKQLNNILLENRLEVLKDKFNDLDTYHDTLAKYKKAHEVVQYFANTADPTSNKKHTQWILNQYKKKNIRQEDSPRIKETLSNFEKHKNKLQNKDLNSYKHLNDVEDAVEPHIDSKSKREEVKDVKHEGAEKIHDENGVQVHHLKTKEAACKYGGGTKWCTAAKKNNMFDDYNSEGKIYHVKARDENGKMAKYQFHHESGQYMNSKDEDVDLHELVKRNPELKNVKEFQGKHPALTSDKNFDRHAHEFFKSHNLASATLKDERIKPKHIDEALSMANNPNPYYRQLAIKHKNASKENLDKAIKDESWLVRDGAARHPNANKDHLNKLLNDENESIRSTAKARLEGKYNIYK